MNIITTMTATADMNTTMIMTATVDTTTTTIMNMMSFVLAGMITVIRMITAKIPGKSFL